MDLFKGKESCKEKFDSNNNWKTAWPRMTFEWHLFLRLSLGFVWKMVSFVRKHLSFYPKHVCSFSLFLFKWKGVKPTIISNKMCRNEICNTTTHKKREREEQKQSKFKNIFKTYEKFSLVTLLTNYHKLLLLPLVVRPWRNFEKQKLVLNFESCYCYFRWVIFS